MPSIADTVDLFQTLESADITVSPERCVVVRNRNAPCRACAEACTSQAIVLDPASNALSVDAAACIGCGSCATACPTGALEAKKPTDAELLASCLAALEANEGEVVIACKQMCNAAKGLIDQGKVVSVACLGRVDESLLSILALRGAEKIRLVRRACDDCPHAAGGRLAERVAETERVLLGTWGRATQVKLSDKLPKSVRKAEGDAYDRDRRAFFHNLKDDAKEAAVKTTDFALESELGLKQKASRDDVMQELHVGGDGTMPHFLPAKRGRLLDVLSKMGEPTDELIDTRLFGHVIIDAGACQSCKMCAVFCPTGALAKCTASDGQAGLSHYPGACVQCHTCEAVCPRQCLTLSEEVFARDVATGRREFYPMESDADIKERNRHGILNAMRKITGGTQIYER